MGGIGLVGPPGSLPQEMKQISTVHRQERMGNTGDTRDLVASAPLRLALFIQSTMSLLDIEQLVSPSPHHQSQTEYQVGFLYLAETFSKAYREYQL